MSQHFDPEHDIYDLRTTPLINIFSKVNNNTPELFINEKPHVKFLAEYLGKEHGLNATFVVIERSYISKDYLSDFSSYYSTSFHDYSKLCTRLHFFAIDASKEEFINFFKQSIVEGVNKNIKHLNFWGSHYLGYLVVKPTPNYFIGFTLLKHYNYSASKSCYNTFRDYWGIKDYKVHVYGNEITVPSIAFQEQDRNVAACATIAIWTMLQRAAEDYYVVLQSPGEITKGSGIVSHNGNRLIPNKGLSILQMAQAITTNNLATEVRDLASYKGADTFNTYLRKLIYAYAPLKIPIILAFSIPDYKNEYTGHVVAIVGNCMEPINLTYRKSFLYKYFTKSKDSRGIIWKADSINKLYVHDDQWGPFATISFSGKTNISSSWNKHTRNNKLSNSKALIISVYQKVRIPYEDIEDKILGINKIIEDHLKEIIAGSFIWEIQLFLSEDFKNIIQQSELYDDNVEEDFSLQFKFLTRGFPKYIWVATLSIDENKIFHFIYDATGLSGSNLLHTILGYYDYFIDTLVQVLEKNINNTDNSFTSIFDYDVNFFIEKLKEFR